LPQTLATKELAVASRQRSLTPTLLACLGPLQLFCFPSGKTKLKGCPFDTIEVTEAESQAVLNTFTEHNFQDAFKKWQKCWEQCIHVEGDYSEVDGGQ
jgi:hypothetical protein